MLTQKLGEVAREYHQIHNQRQGHGEADGNAAHRRQGQRMAKLRDRFERLLLHWCADQRLAEAWRRHLYHTAPAPSEPELAVPPIFRGRNEAGARIEVRPANGEGSTAYDIFCDGARVGRESVPWHLDPESIEPVVVAGQTCVDTFDASPEAIEALRSFVANPGAEPPWRFGRELYEDGLVDPDFALTGRGRRCLHRPARVAPRMRGGGRAHYCVVAADSARARILLLAAADSSLAATLMPLTEVADLSRPDGRARFGELHSDSRPGLNSDPGAGPASGHAVSDHRENRRQQASRDFAESVVEAAERVWRTLPGCHIVVSASPPMLGFLRPALARRAGGQPPLEVRELGRDLSKLAPAALHDALATAGLLPARGRRRTRPPVWQRDAAGSKKAG